MLLQVGDLEEVVLLRPPQEEDVLAPAAPELGMGGARDDGVGGLREERGRGAEGEQGEGQNRCADGVMKVYACLMSNLGGNKDRRQRPLD